MNGLSTFPACSLHQALLMTERMKCDAKAKSPEYDHSDDLICQLALSSFDLNRVAERTEKEKKIALTSRHDSFTPKTKDCCR